jgi:hypothetical protein
MTESTNTDGIFELKTKINLRRSEKRSSDKRFTQVDLKELVNESGHKFIGSGEESVVYKPKGDTSDTVVALDHDKVNSPVEAKLLFQTHRLMATLLPYNFPRNPRGFGHADPINGVSGMTRKEIIPIDDAKSDISVKYPFSHVVEVVKLLKLPVNMDMNAFNIKKDADGNEWNVDRVLLKKTGTAEGDSWNVEAIEEYMGKEGYSEIDKRIVKKSIERINYLKTLIVEGEKE